MLKKFFAALAVLFFIFSATPTKTSAAEVITVTGSAVGPKNAIVGSNFYKSFARQAAKIDALRQLVESVKGVQVDSESKVEDFDVTSDFVKVELNFDERLWNKYFSKIEVVEIKFSDKGDSCEVKMKGTLK